MKKFGSRIFDTHDKYNEWLFQNSGYFEIENVQMQVVQESPMSSYTKILLTFSSLSIDKIKD